MLKRYLQVFNCPYQRYFSFCEEEPLLNFHTVWENIQKLTVLVTEFKICLWLSLKILAEMPSIPVVFFIPKLLPYLRTQLLSTGWKENNSI